MRIGAFRKRARARRAPDIRAQLECLESRILLANVNWAVAGSGAWDTTSLNWSGGSNRYTEGDNVTFGALGAGINPTITIQSGGVTPGQVLFSHYQNSYTFQGGNIGGNTAMILGQPYGSTVTFSNYGAGLTFTGGITLNNGSTLTWAPNAAGTYGLGTGTITINQGTFRYQPTVTGNALNNVLNLGTSGVTLLGNANSNWGSVTANMNGTVTLGNNNGTSGITNSYTGLNLLMNGDRQINLTANYSNVNRSIFNGIVTGALNTLTVNTVTSTATHVADITGPGNWNIRGFTKTGVGIVNILAPEVFGQVLKIEQGKVQLGNASQTHTVSDLWLGGVRITAPGTYGATGSGAQYINDTYFAGPGKVTLRAVPTVTVQATTANATEEGGQNGVFTFTRTGPTTSDLVINYNLNGSTTSAADYVQNLSGAFIIPAGQSSATLTVTAVNDSNFEDVYEKLVLNINPSATYAISTTDPSSTIKFTDTDLPANNVMQFSIPMTAGINGFRANWDTADTTTLGFDAINRSLLVRFPGISDAIKRMVLAGHTITKAELVLPYAGIEKGSDATYKYTYRSSQGVGDKWNTTTPNWHAVAYGVRRPWTADATIGPTYNAYINAGNGGYGYWAKYGAQDTTYDRYAQQFGADAASEVSASNPNGRVDITAMLNDSSFGATLADRILQLEENGNLVKKWEEYDFKFRSTNDPYEWGIEVGGAGNLDQPAAVGDHVFGHGHAAGDRHDAECCGCAGAVADASGWPEDGEGGHASGVRCAQCDLCAEEA